MGTSIFLVDGDKGGVGKSFVARLLADYMISVKRYPEVHIIDADARIGDVVAKGSAYSDEVIQRKDGSVTHVHAQGLVATQEDHAIDLAERIADARTCGVVNLAAGFAAILGEHSRAMVGGVDTVPVWVMGADEASTRCFEAALRDVYTNVQRGVIVLNLHSAERKNFVHFDAFLKKNPDLLSNWGIVELTVMSPMMKARLGTMPWHRVTTEQGSLTPVYVERFRNSFARAFDDALAGAV